MSQQLQNINDTVVTVKFPDPSRSSRFPDRVPRYTLGVNPILRRRGYGIIQSNPESPHLLCR
jgi:hypothetical protein